MTRHTSRSAGKVPFPARRLLRHAACIAAVLGMAEAMMNTVTAAQAAELVMFETAGCVWCDAWNRDVGGIYHKTAEGRIASLRRVELHAPRPDNLRGIEGIVYTPTFVLLEDGQEIGRINGYPGNDHFWGLLSVLVKKLQPVSESRSRAPAAILESNHIPAGED